MNKLMSRGATSGATIVAKKRQTGGAIQHPIRSDGLTDKQRVFVKIYAENEGRLTPTECARQAGYSEASANVTSSQLLNGKRYPKVVEAIIKRRAEIEKTHEVKLNKHVQELARLRAAVSVPIMVDESLVTLDDARALIEASLPK